jgi:hypothetical protein
VLSGTPPNTTSSTVFTLTVGATNGVSPNTSQTLTVTVPGAVTKPAQSPVASSDGSTLLVNLSTRGLAAAGSNALIGGFVISGSGQKTILVRGMASALSAFGLSGTLRKPLLTVVDGRGQTVARATTQQTYADSAANGMVTRTNSQVGAFAFNFQGTNGTQTGDAGAVLVVGPGQYTASIAPDQDTPTGTNSSSGIVLLEVYDVSQGSGGDGCRLINVATRGTLTAGAEQMIVGFVIKGAGNRRVLLRGVGPGLGSFGLAGTAPDPTLTLYDAASKALASNDDWGMSAQTDQMALLSPMVGAFSLAGTSKDAGVLFRLPSGNYTAAVLPNGGTGLGIVEVYETP